MDHANSAHCRLCAELKPLNKLIDVQAEAEKRQELVEKLGRVNAYIDWYLDDFPTTVCFVCANALDRSYEFICGIEKAQHALQDIFTVQRIKKEASLSDNEIFDFDGADVKFDVNIKVELNEAVNDEKLGASVVKSAKKFPSTKKQKKRPRNFLKNSLDAIPLAQLKLTWKDYSWTCAYCETQFPTVDELKVHSMEYHQCCNAYKCTDCHIRKLRLESFMIHVKRHRKYLKLSCYKCFRRFPTTREVNVHKRSHLATSHVCPGCNTTFDSAEEMDSHSSQFYKDKRCRQQQMLEADTDNLTCLLCNKTFKYKGTLSTHLLTHTDRKRDHTCDKCGKCFLNKQNLAGHMLLHSELRPYQCEICRCAFKTPQQLRSHVGVHDGVKPYSCDQCGRCFRLQKQLTSHSIIHTDLLPHVCSFCNKGFRFKTILNQHLRQHTGVKPYSCEVCNRDFTNWPNYNKHMKRRHGMDMAKKKHTPDGVYPVNPITGEVIVFPTTDQTLEWKKKMTEQRRPGRPKQSKNEEDETPLNSEEKKAEVAEQKE